MRRAKLVFPAQYTPATRFPPDPRVPRGGMDVPCAGHCAHSAWLGSGPSHAGLGEPGPPPAACCPPQADGPGCGRRAGCGGGNRFRPTTSGAADALASPIEVRVTSSSGRRSSNERRAAATCGDVCRWPTSLAPRLASSRRVILRSSSSLKLRSGPSLCSESPHLSWPSA